MTTALVNLSKLIKIFQSFTFTARETYMALKIKIKGVRFFLTPCLSWGFPLQISIVGIPARSLFVHYHESL